MNAIAPQRRPDATGSYPHQQLMRHATLPFYLVFRLIRVEMFCQPCEAKACDAMTLWKEFHPETRIARDTFKSKG